MLSLYLPALLVAVVITMLELTEVVAIVFALAADAHSVRSSALGAVAGTAVVALAALALGAALLALPTHDLLGVAALVLAAFGVFLFRSTLRTYRRVAAARAGRPPTFPPHHAVQFAGGFTAGAIETTEVVVVLLGLTAAGYGGSALVGALVGGVLIAGAAAAVHEQIRRIKVPWLKLGATSMLFTFAVFWAGEALGYAWPGGDLSLVPLFVLAVAIVRGAVAVTMRSGAPAVAPTS